MSRRKPTVDGDGRSHRRAATAFARRIEERVDGVERLLLFGSTVRGDASGRSSDVDFLAVVADEADRTAVEERLREVAYDVMLEFGPVVEVHVLSRQEFERRRDRPFVRRVVRDGESYV
ncbi:nucleotidyltransferase domain-containing protein [Halosimplex salinum]|uniref:nucleotidyltransferase domain-containing protein n=1 Tax=Halosimplex salinum TaxID=1710538 RepID=UPI000F497C97|nr:nucleotidyltransferase domain-containing protein [Halosimplex salinum]